MAIDLTKYGKSIEEVEGKSVNLSKYGTAAEKEVVKEQPKGETGLKGFSTGFAKGGLGSIKTLGQLGEKILPPIGRDKVYSEESLAKSKLGSILTEENLKGNSTAEKLGKGAEFIAEIATPTTLVNKGIKLATATKTAIKALNPELTGNKLINAYKEIVTAKRTASNLGLLGKQTLSPKQDTILLADRLKGVITSLNPVKNLKSLSNELKNTELKIESALKGNPDIIYNADKVNLVNKFDGIKTQIPREFSAIKDNKKIYEDVIKFAKETLNNVSDDIIGLRNGRTAFDTQAKLEYPNAFKDGAIDIKTPAGRAIKFIRDTWNNHLYDTAPNGSEIKQLIGREADIFRATDSIAPKAAKFNELNKFQQISKSNPVKTKILGGTLGAGLGYGVLNTVGKKLLNNNSSNQNFSEINQ